MDDFTLTRSGQAPLAFTGELLAEAGGRYQTGRDQNRYHTVAVYRTAGGKYVVSVTYDTDWQGEVGHAAAVVLDGPADVAAFLQGYDPLARVGGYPPEPAYAVRQQRLLAGIRERYDALVSEVLAEPEFAEHID